MYRESNGTPNGPCSMPPAAFRCAVLYMHSLGCIGHPFVVIIEPRPYSQKNQRGEELTQGQINGLQRGCRSKRVETVQNLTRRRPPSSINRCRSWILLKQGLRTYLYLLLCSSALCTYVSCMIQHLLYSFTRSDRKVSV